MKVEQVELRPRSAVGSGLVRQFLLPGGRTRITQISTFCPDVIGPGPTNLYLVDNGAVILVDAGIPTQLAKIFFYQWRNQRMPRKVEMLAPDHSEHEFLEGMKLAGYEAASIEQLVLTHGHPDHFLMAKSILRNSNAGISAHILDTPSICNPWGMLHMWFSRQKQMVSTGMPHAKTPHELLSDESLRSLNLKSLGVSLTVDSPLFQDGPVPVKGSPVEGVEAIHLPGHSPGSLGLIVGNSGEKKVLICGDVLLNPITPHPDDLLVYLQTIHELGKRDDIGLVLPAHGRQIRDLKGRVKFLSAHHRNRLQHTYEACSVPRCVWDVATMENYFDTYVDPTKFNFLAGMQALVHLELLVMVDAMRRTEIRDEVHYFQNTGEPFDEVYGRVVELVLDKGSRAMMRY